MHNGQIIVHNYGYMSLTLEQRPAETTPTARSFVEFSLSRVGKVWTDQDHAALLHHLAQVDELCITIWKRLQNSHEQHCDRDS